MLLTGTVCVCAGGHCMGRLCALIIRRHCLDVPPRIRPCRARRAALPTLLVAGTTPRTVNAEWRAARAKMDLSKERVAGDPVEVNPIRHAGKQKL